MTGEEIVAKMKELNLPKNTYVVFGSGPMAAAGLRESNDIDLLVSKDVFVKLKEAGWKEQVKSLDDKPLTHEIFEAHNNWNFSSYNPTLEHLLASATEVEGIPFASLNEVRKWKIASGRPKDLNDVKLIDERFISLKILGRGEGIVSKYQLK